MPHVPAGVVSCTNGNVLLTLYGYAPTSAIKAPGFWTSSDKVGGVTFDTNPQRTKSRVTMVRNGQVVTIDTNGVTSQFAAAAENLAIDPATGDTLWTEPSAGRVRRLNYASGLIDTAAGSGASSCAGDGGSAASAGLQSPTSLLVERDSSVLVAQGFGCHRIRNISAAGTITGFAGRDSPLGGFGGDGGTASEATFCTPSGLAVYTPADGSGPVYYVADRDNHRIRRIDSDGRVSTAAGNGTAGYSGGVGVTATMRLPTDVAVDQADGTVYFVDSGNYVIRALLPNGTVALVAGTPGSQPGVGDRVNPIDAVITPRRLWYDSRLQLLLFTDVAGTSLRAVTCWPTGVRKGGLLDLLTGIVTDCPAGRYCPSDGRTFSVLGMQFGVGVCKSGFYCPSGSADPVQCPAGFYCPPAVYDSGIVPRWL